MVYSLFYILGLLLVSGLLLAYEIRRNENILLKYWFLGVLFYFLRMLIVILAFLKLDQYSGLSDIFYSSTLFLYGLSIASFNSGLNYLISYRKNRLEISIFLSLFFVVSISYFIFDLGQFNLLFLNRFTISLGLLHLAFGAYRVWIEKKLVEARLLAINFSLWGLVTPIILIYLRLSSNIEYLALIDAVFITLFMGISLFFTSSFKRRSEANLLDHLKYIYTYSSDIFLLLDKKGKLLKSSSSFTAVFNLNKNEMNSLKFTDIIAPEFNDICLEKWERVVLGKSASVKLKPNLQYLKDEDVFQIDFVLSPIFEENMFSMVSVVGKLEKKETKTEAGKTNIADRKSMDAELEQFLSLTSHELQSPMIVLEGYVSALAHAIKDMSLPPEVKEYPKFIIKSVKKVSELIQAILNLSKAGSNKTQMTAVDLNQVFSQVEGEIVQQFSSGSYNLKIDKNLPLVKGDKIQLAQLFINLIKNSIKYASVDRKPEIRIGIDIQDKNSVTLFIKDNGIGMASNNLDSIFCPMQRLHKKEVEGYGLGLTLVKKTAEAHGATIRVESKENVGSTFFVKLNKYQHE